MAALRSAFFLLFMTTALLFTTAVAENRYLEIHTVGRIIIPFDEFGFTHSGVLELNVSQFSFSYPDPNLKPDLSQVGFFLCTRDFGLHVLEHIAGDQFKCPLLSDSVKQVLTFDKLQSADRYDLSFKVSAADHFILALSNCVPDLKLHLKILSAMYNVDAKTGRRDYLSVGKTNLPWIYFLFFLIYSSMAGIWVFILYNKRLSAYRIHFFMLALIILKALNLLCETEFFSYIKKTGGAYGWDVLFYIFRFLKGITLFTLIVLIGTGWSFLKPYLQDKEKKVLMIVVSLQVIANVAPVVIDESGFYWPDIYTWKQVFLLVDLICCCAVLFPIVWSIKSLREAARTDGKAAVNLMKLKLFRQYYIAVICYIYFTRVVVYALEAITSYQYQWTSVVAAELVTLAFYVFTGYNFRPKVHNPYFALDDEEEAAAEALKLEDECEL